MTQGPGSVGFSRLLTSAPVGRPAGVGESANRWRPAVPAEATLQRNTDAWIQTHGHAPAWATFNGSIWSEADETLAEAQVLLDASSRPDAELVIVIGAGNGAIIEAID